MNPRTQQSGPLRAAPVVDPALTGLLAAVAGAGGAWCPALSPDGAQVAYVTDRDGAPVLEIAPTERPDPELPGRVVSPAGQEVISVSWSPGGDWLAYLVSPGGSIRAELWRVRPDGSDAARVAGGGPVTVFAGCWISAERYACTIADGPGAAVHLVDIPQGTHEKLQHTAGLGFCTITGSDGTRLLLRIGPRGRRRQYLVDIAGPAAPEPLLADIAEDARFAGPDLVHLRCYAGQDRLVLARIRLPGGEPEIVARRDDADLDGYALRSDGSLLLLWNVLGRNEIEVLDADGSTEPVTLPQPVLPGWSLLPTGDGMIAELAGPSAPRSLQHVTFADGRPAAPVVRVPAAIPEATLPEQQRFSSLDGRELHGWWYPPAVGGGVPGPVVVAFHGGPESQERPSYQWVPQGLALAGIGVFAPDVRGSSGHGRRFLEADDGARRPDSFQDVVASVRHLIDTGRADARRIGVHGWSYGGYLALTALTRWPEMFAAGTTLAGMSDLLSFFAEAEPWMAASSVTEYGDPGPAADLLRALSPLTHLDRVRAPVLLVHGAADTNVPLGESTRAHAALRAVGVPTELLVLSGEGHTVVGREHRIEALTAIVSWFTRWLTAPTHEGGIR